MLPCRVVYRNEWHSIQRIVSVLCMYAAASARVLAVSLCFRILNKRNTTKLRLLNTSMWAKQYLQIARFRRSHLKIRWIAICSLKWRANYCWLSLGNTRILLARLFRRIVRNRKISTAYSAATNWLKYFYHHEDSMSQIEISPYLTQAQRRLKEMQSVRLQRLHLWNSVQQEFQDNFYHTQLELDSLVWAAQMYS